MRNWVFRRVDPGSAGALLLLLLICPAAAAQCNADPVAAADAVVYTGGSIVVVDVLANDIEPDGEALTLDNLSTTCTGTVSEDLGLVTLTVTGFSGDCAIGYRITDESGGTDTATVTVSGATEIFADGFETGDTSRWASAAGRVGR